MPGLIVFGEIDPNGGVVVGFVGDLDGVAEAGSEVLIGIEFQPEADRAVFRAEIIQGLEIDRFGVLDRKFESVAFAASGFGVFDAGAFQPGYSRLFVVGRRVDRFIAAGRLGRGGTVESGAEDCFPFPVGGLNRWNQ